MYTTPQMEIISRMETISKMKKTKTKVYRKNEDDPEIKECHRN